MSSLGNSNRIEPHRVGLEDHSRNESHTANRSDAVHMQVLDRRERWNVEAKECLGQIDLVLAGQNIS